MTSTRWTTSASARRSLLLRADEELVPLWGFEVVVVKDATAAAITPDLGDGYAAALTNFAFLASDVITTEEAVELLDGGS